MNARRVHAVLAAAVQSPDLIPRWQAEPHLLAQLGIEPQSLDLQGLWKFAGLTVKVRHNGVRQILPLTFRLLSLAGLEIDLFAAYAAHRATTGQRLAAATHERASELRDFLEEWLDRDRVVHALVWDIVRHEQTLNQLGLEAPTVHQPRGRAPMLCGRVVLHEMMCDPLELAAILHHNALPTDLSIRPRRFCYWAADPGDTRILELDDFGYYALSFVDGTRSMTELGRLLTGATHPSRAFLRLLRQLAAIGIVSLPMQKRLRR